MLRNGAAVLFGLIASFITVALVEWLSSRLYPPPPGLDFKDPEQVRQFIENLPIGAFAMVLLAWTAGTLVGALVACNIGREKPLVFASIIGVIMMAATIANLVLIPHPTWFSISAIVLIALASLLAARIASTTGKTWKSL